MDKPVKIDDGGSYMLVGGEIIKGVHSPKKCAGEPCTIHNPSDHHMREWAQNWRPDRQLMERLCEHGVGHPDPDDPNPDTTHGCDGCCGRPLRVLDERAGDAAELRSRRDHPTLSGLAKPAYGNDWRAGVRNATQSLLWALKQPQLPDDERGEIVDCLELLTLIEKH